MNIPKKPFPTYKWRWLSVQPSEGLLKAPVFLGVLRALQHHEGQPYSSVDLYNELARVKIDTGTRIELARTPERNLFRNSGQYWRGTGLIEQSPGIIRLTNLGHNVATGQLTNDEFAALMIRNTVLPNPATYSPADIAEWKKVGLRIKPFELIIGIMDNLARKHGIFQAYLSANELIKIVIPLAGAKNSVKDISSKLFAYRNDRLDISEWPNCVPKANDKRLAREFLLFLANFDICQVDENSDRYNQKFLLTEMLSNEMHPDEQVSFFENNNITEEEINISRGSDIPIIIERKRISISIIQRNNQSRFRKNVINAAQGQCILTRESTRDVLEAAHIIPVGHGGTDNVDNGFCMRADIHKLFDNGKIRVSSNGEIFLNEHIEDAISYSDLPRNIDFPEAVDLKNIEWRSRYL